MPDFTLDWPHGHQTRDGLKARIICRDFKSTSGPIVAIVVQEDGTESLYGYRDDGRATHFCGGGYDLINSPAPKKVWEGWANEHNLRVVPIRIEFPSEV